MMSMRTETTIIALLPTATVVAMRQYFGTTNVQTTYEAPSGISDEDQRLIDQAQAQLAIGDVDACYATLNTYSLAKREDRQYDFGF
jgi:hypothetical protein